MTDVRTDPLKFTLRDYLELPEGFPAELIDGQFVKEPAPPRWHQWVVVEILVRLRAAVGGDRVLVAPVDVYVDDLNALQPDLLVTAEGDRVRPESPPGAVPVLVVEVLTPGSAPLDRDVKTATYLRAGVGEVWLVDPSAGTVDVHRASGVVRCAGEMRAASEAAPGFTLAWGDLAPRPAPGDPGAPDEPG